MFGSGRRMDTVFVIAVFCVFAVSVLMTLMLGAQIYKKTIEKTAYDTCMPYIWTKVKNMDGTVSTGEFHGISALFIDEDYDGTAYRTIIYLYDGWVMELFSEKDLEFLPEDGMPVIKTETLVFDEAENGLITVNSGNLFILPRVRSDV